MSASVGHDPERGSPLSWSRTVARETVHRTSTAEVLLNDVRPRGDGFEAAASWPRSHPTFPCDGGSLHSPLILVETLRQLGIYLPLRHFGIPPAAHLLITDLFFDIDQGAEPRAGFGGTDVTCRIDVPEVRRARGGAVIGLRLAVTFLAARRGVRPGRRRCAFPRRAPVRRGARAGRRGRAAAGHARPAATATGSSARSRRGSRWPAPGTC